MDRCFPRQRTIRRDYYNPRMAFQTLSHGELQSLTAEQLVNKLWDKRIRSEVIRALVGGLTAGELRQARLSDEARRALIEGLGHWSPKVLVVPAAHRSPRR